MSNTVHGLGGGELLAATHHRGSEALARVPGVHTKSVKGSMLFS